MRFEKSQIEAIYSSYPLIDDPITANFRPLYKTVENSSSKNTTVESRVLKQQNCGWPGKNGKFLTKYSQN